MSEEDAMKVVIRTEVEFEDDPQLDERQLEDLSEFVSDEAGHKLRHIITAPTKLTFGSIQTEATLVPPTVGVTVRGCARCGGVHDLEWNSFLHPIKLGDQEWTKWAICPATGEPIMMRTVPQVFACKR